MNEWAPRADPVVPLQLSPDTNLVRRPQLQAKDEYGYEYEYEYVPPCGRRYGYCATLALDD
jgi:hypothetical protein